MQDETSSRLDTLERRVAALEKLAADGGTERRTATPDLRQIDELRHRDGPRYARDDMHGAVMYAGAASFGEGEVLWAGEHGLAEVWDLEHAGVARLLAALAHPARIALVQALLTGTRTSQELQGVIDSGSAGQLYHHLRDLMAAGVVDQGGRSRYRVASSRVVPLLVILAAASDVARPQEYETRPVPQQEEGAS